MPKMNVAFALDTDELQRFDAWREGLARGAALIQLLEIADEFQVGARVEKKEEPSRLEKARAALAAAESGENKGAFDAAPSVPAQVRKRDPMDQSPDYPDEYAQYPVPDDVDQRRKGRGK